MEVTVTSISWWGANESYGNFRRLVGCRWKLGDLTPEQPRLSPASNQIYRCTHIAPVPLPPRSGTDPPPSDPTAGPPPPGCPPQYVPIVLLCSQAARPPPSPVDLVRPCRSPESPRLLHAGDPAPPRLTPARP
jgi:hypothetical protein